jgi:hypothetical protein
VDVQEKAQKEDISEIAEPEAAAGSGMPVISDRCDVLHQSWGEMGILKTLVAAELSS